MRWNEILSEELGVVQKTKSYIMDILASLESQGVSKITVQQVVDQLSRNPEMEGVQVDAGLINQAVKGVEGVNVTPDPETGQMSVIVDTPEAGRQVDAKQAEKDDKKVHSAAMKTIDRKDSE